MTKSSIEGILKLLPAIVSIAALSPVEHDALLTYFAPSATLPVSFSLLNWNAGLGFALLSNEFVRGWGAGLASPLGFAVWMALTSRVASALEVRQVLTWPQAVPPSN